MKHYHQKTLELLQIIDPDFAPYKTEEYYTNSEHYDEELDIIPPASYREWAVIEEKFKFLEKYSLEDIFDFSDDDILELDDGRLLLRFHVERQENFEKAILLDGSDDPPVLYAWVGEEPWVHFSNSFSDSVYAHIFDWQYLIEQNKDGYPEIVHHGSIKLKSDRSLDYLKKNFKETVSTSYIMEDITYTEYRFLGASGERLLATVADDLKDMEIRITGDKNLIFNLEQELLSIFFNELKPNGFSNISEVKDFFESNVKLEKVFRIKYGCLNIPDEKSLMKLAEMDIRNQFPSGRFPRNEKITTIEIDGLVVKLTSIGEGWRVIDSIKSIDI